jgi:hypothetical protein
VRTGALTKVGVAAIENMTPTIRRAVANRRRERLRPPRNISQTTGFYMDSIEEPAPAPASERLTSARLA